ncbi:MAG: hypothetical protein PVSMB6_03190 [Steroidobacteraceae bacterium]
MRAGQAACKALLLAGVLAGATARADGLYVIEQLVVSVSSAPGGAGEHIASLRSGERVEVIERAGEEFHVRLAGGKDGWIRASYLSTAEPLRPQLTARTAEVASLRQQVERLQADLRAARAAPPTAPVPAVAAAAGAATGEPPAAAGLFGAADGGRGPRWGWVWLSALACLGAGFVLGWRVLDRRIRAKYGGLRIY